MVSEPKASFTEFETGEPVLPFDQRQTPSRRASDVVSRDSLDIIAHKTTRLATEFTEFKADIHKAIDRIEGSMRYNHATLTEMIQRTEKKVVEHEQREETSLKECMLSIVPGGDVDGHRRHHEALIKRAEESAEFWSTMRKEIGKYGLIGFIGWAGFYLWQAFLMGPRK